MTQQRQVSILVVDDFQPWRIQIRNILQGRREWKIVSEACDGPEAIKKAIELKPDVILLDIGLPALNGIEAAERIFTLVPDVTILFVTQQNDDDVVNAAISIGAKGYVLKPNVNRELLPALEAVLKGWSFIGSDVMRRRGSPSLLPQGVQ